MECSTEHRDLRDQFLRLETETETEQVQFQQARPRLKRYSLNKQDRDSYLGIFETETRKMVETDSLADLTIDSIYNLYQT